LLYNHHTLFTGDLYGGAHYSQSASATLTLQGRAIQDASRRFGDGSTLPFTPCKRGFVPMIQGKPMFACRLHHEQRYKRFMKEGETFRPGEVDLNVFWGAGREGTHSQESVDLKAAVCDE
jgi:hypothetical protein